MHTSTSSLLVLGPDILHLIIAILAEPPSPFSNTSTPCAPLEESTLVSLSSTCTLLRELAKPVLFEEIIIRSVRDSSAFHLEVVALRVERLLHVEKSARDGGILRFVKTFHFSLHHPTQSYRPPVPAALLARLSTILSRLPLLETLHFSFPQSAAIILPFSLTSIRLPLVTTLIVGRSSLFALPLCPNVHTVQAARFFRSYASEYEPSEAHAIALFEAVAGAPSVRELRVEEPWSFRMAEALASTPTTITSLASISFPAYVLIHIPLASVLSPLARIPSLRTLELGPCSTLNVDFDLASLRMKSSPTDPLLRQRRAAELRVLKIVDEVFGEGLVRVRIGKAGEAEEAVFERWGGRDWGKEGTAEKERGRDWGRGVENGVVFGEWVGVKTAWEMEKERKGGAAKKKKKRWGKRAKKGNE